jgi:platelet-activating factor acetylhydrolase isoform II
MKPSILAVLIVLLAPLSALAQDQCSVNLPAPGGPFKVGRTPYHFVDRESKREMMVYAWYPADAGGTKTAVYIPYWEEARDRITESVKRALGAGLCALENKRALLHALQDAPVAGKEARYPLLLFSHGAGVASLTYAAQLEDLASHGYIVAALEYTPVTAGLVVMPDGQPVKVNPDQMRNPGTTPEERLVWEKKQIDEFAQSLRSALDELIRLDGPGVSAHPLRGRIDFSRVGIFAHSFGGMAALRALQLDSRIRAGLNQDGLSAGMIAFAKEVAFDKPFGLLTPTRTPEQNNRYEELFKVLPLPAEWITLAGPQIEHMSFTDLLLFRNAEDAGKRAAALHNLQLVREFTRRYFDVHLKGQPRATITFSADQYPEVTLRIR